MSIERIQQHFTDSVATKLAARDALADPIAAAADLMVEALSNGNKALVLNNGLPNAQRTSAGDSSRNGQLDNAQAYGGFSSPTFGTLTFGRQYSLTLDGVIAYDPMSASNAFSLIGFAGMTPGAGNTEDARLDDSLKYRVNIGPFRAAGVYKFDDHGDSNRNAGKRDAYRDRCHGDPAKRDADGNRHGDVDIRISTSLRPVGDGRPRGPRADSADPI